MADGDNQQRGSSDQAESGQQQTGESVRVELPPNTETTQEGTPNVLARGIFQRHIKLDPILLIYIVALLVGGIYGYLEKKSTISLVSGVISALLLSIGAYFEGYRRNFYPLIITLAVLAIGFTYRYFVNFKFIPSGLFATLTILMLVRHGYIIYLRRQRV